MESNDFKLPPGIEKLNDDAIEGQGTLSHKPIPKMQEPKEVIRGVLKDYVAMNKCAIIHTAFTEYLKGFYGDDTLTVANIRTKLEELEVEAEKKVRIFENILQSYSEE